MSVIRSKRAESEMEFIHTARQLQVYMIQKCVGFPKRYTFYIAQPIANAATRVHEYTKMANSVYPTNPHEVQLRRDYLLRANAELNSLVSQIEVAHELAKEVLRIRGYGRYMDDGYLIHESKEYLQYCLMEIRKVCRELGITINEKKTQIVKISHGFTFLKARFYLTETGKVIRKIYKKSIVRERRKLKKFVPLLESGVMSYTDVKTAFQSWCAYAKNFSAWHTIQNMCRLYNELFIYPWIKQGRIQGC